MAASAWLHSSSRPGKRIRYVEGLDSERAIAWRAADSLSLRSFLRLAPPAAPPDHSTISRTRRLLSVETHEAVFTWVLQQLADAGLVQGRTVGIDGLGDDVMAPALIDGLLLCRFCIDVSTGGRIASNHDIRADMESGDDNKR